MSRVTTSWGGGVVRGEGGNGYRLMEVGDPAVVTQAARWVTGGGGEGARQGKEPGGSGRGCGGGIPGSGNSSGKVGGRGGGKMEARKG